MKNEVVFDLEIKKSIRTTPITASEPLKENEVNGWANSHLAGISCVVLYDYLTDRYRIYDEHNLKDLEKRLEQADRVIGFNHINFDYKVLNGSGCSIVPSDLKDYDILAKLKAVAGWGGGLKLDLVAQETLGISKSGDGAFAPVLWQEGKWAELVDYCIQDVKVTKELWDFICVNGFVKARGGQKFTLKV